MLKVLDKINNPTDLKKLNIDKLNLLAADIREVLLKKLSVHGGHFGPNFGFVEATIALHYVFDSPSDKIVYDVSHQAYAHKILTGRKAAFICEEHYDDVSGYTDPAESPHDFFKIGHTSTSVSLASGLAKARDLKGENFNVIAVIGDGSLSGGEAFEGFDFQGEQTSNFIIVVNDNDMSIAENHGGIYKNLKLLRKTDGKAELNLFKAMGLNYVYVRDGNDVSALIKAFESVKNCDRPTVVHLNTLKGKGYEFAEKNKEAWHWTMPFDIKTGKRVSTGGENYADLTADFLLGKMKADKTVCAVVAAVPASIGFDEQKRKLAGKQFIDVGIAEEHAIALVSGTPVHPPPHTEASCAKGLIRSLFRSRSRGCAAASSRIRPRFVRYPVSNPGRWSPPSPHVCCSAAAGPGSRQTAPFSAPIPLRSSPSALCCFTLCRADALYASFRTPNTHRSSALSAFGDFHTTIFISESLPKICANSRCRRR